MESKKTSKPEQLISIWSSQPIVVAFHEPIMNYGIYVEDGFELFLRWNVGRHGKDADKISTMVRNETSMSDLSRAKISSSWMSDFPEIYT